MDSRSAIISLKNRANIKGTVRQDLWGLFYFKFVRKYDSEVISSKFLGPILFGFYKKKYRPEAKLVN
jgi:hypothetical protein